VCEDRDWLLKIKDLGISFLIPESSNRTFLAILVGLGKIGVTSVMAVLPEQNPKCSSIRRGPLDVVNEDGCLRDQLPLHHVGDILGCSPLLDRFHAGQALRNLANVLDRLHLP
jgi:hypothetical protein